MKSQRVRDWVIESEGGIEREKESDIHCICMGR